MEVRSNKWVNLERHNSEKYWEELCLLQTEKEKDQLMRRRLCQVLQNKKVKRKLIWSKCLHNFFVLVVPEAMTDCSLN